MLSPAAHEGGQSPINLRDSTWNPVCMSRNSVVGKTKNNDEREAM